MTTTDPGDKLLRQWLDGLTPETQPWPGDLPEMPPEMEDAPDPADDTQPLEPGRNEVPRMGGKTREKKKPGAVDSAAIKAAFGPTNWRWMPWLPDANMAMIAAEQGRLKSWLAAYFIAVSTGAIKTWPDGTEYTGPVGKVLLIETESMRGTWAERLEAMGVQDDMVLWPCPDMANPDPFYVPELPRDMAMIEAVASENNVVLIVLDSLTGSHGQDENDAKMKAVMRPLSQVAGKLGVPVVIVHHCRKRNDLIPQRISQKVSLDRIRGSSTISQFCRSIIGLYRLDDSPESPVRAENIKNNLAKPGKPFGFSVGTMPDTGKLGLLFGDAPQDDTTRTATDDALEFINNMLRTGPQDAARMLGDAEVLGISLTALNTAKRLAGVKSDREGTKWVWKLPNPDRGQNG